MEGRADFENDPISSVAWHEAGHVLAFKVIGRALFATVVPDSESLGRAKGVFSPTRSFKERLFDGIFVSLAGQVAEEMAGEQDHRGTRGDWGYAEYLATIASVATNNSVDKILSEGLSHCRSVLSSIGLRVLRTTAMHLWEKKAVAY